MSYTSLIFIAYVIGIVFVYFIIPKKVRWLCLLLASYAFYYLASGAGLMIYLVITTSSIFFLALWIERIEKNNKSKIKEAGDITRDQKDRMKASARKRKKWLVFLGLILNFGILGYFKYSNFIIVNIDALFDASIPTSTLLVPMGISFYTFQSTAYLIDVYRGKFAADRNLAKFALFTSFFPQIVQGPISRYDQLANQLYEGHGFDFTRVKYGIQLMLWGYFQKLVIADRAYILVVHMLDNYQSYEGFEVAIGMFAIAIRSYTDFAGGIDISRGIAQILGINLVKNFKQPYFGTSLRNYWSRWHVTLGQWFRDYFYYSLLFSKGWRKFITWSQKHLGKYFGKVLPVAIGMGFTFFLVGIWHGAAWKYMLFGVYNGILVLIGILIMPFLKTMNEKHHLVKIHTFSWRIFLTLGTFVIICFSKLITGCNNVSQTFVLFKGLFSEFNPWIFFDGSIYELGLPYAEFTILMIAILVLFIMDIIKECGISIRGKLDEQNLYFRWVIDLAAIISIIIFGMYGGEIIQDFIYQQF